MSEVKKQEILNKTDLMLYELNAIVLDDYDRKEHRENAQEIIYVIEGLLDLYNKEKQKNKALKEGLKYRINYCKLLEKELYANGVNYEFEKTEIEKQFFEE